MAKTTLQADGPTKETAAAAERAAKAEKRATFFHTDSGYGIEIVDGDAAPTSERHTTGLDGLDVKMDELKKAGFEVSFEGLPTL